MGDLVKNRFPKGFSAPARPQTRDPCFPSTSPTLSLPYTILQATVYEPHAWSQLSKAKSNPPPTNIKQTIPSAPPLRPVPPPRAPNIPLPEQTRTPPKPIVTVQAPSPSPSKTNQILLPAALDQNLVHNAPPTLVASESADKADGEGSSADELDNPIEQQLGLNTKLVTPTEDYLTRAQNVPGSTMSRRKIWIKRPGASSTLVQVNSDDLVDEVRDMVMRKYANSLGRTFDAPDVTIRIRPREPSQQSTERVLSPEESICRILDAYFPGGQNIDEALLVEVPPRRTPRLSPRPAEHMNGYLADHNQRPVENEGDYFPPMPQGPSSPRPQSLAGDITRPNFHTNHTMAILENVAHPPLPSPRERRNPRPRPGVARQHTSSPTTISGSVQRAAHPGRTDLRQVNNAIPSPPPLPTPPASGLDSLTRPMLPRVSTPPLDRLSPPRGNKTKRARKTSMSAPQRPGPEGRKASDKAPMYSLLEGVVPPINVLIVEDNPINLQILEHFARRLKVRWSTAINGRIAVNKWKTGGFHLVLMDIQLPIMSGLEATKEIRRLERVNGIGVFARADGPKLANGAIKEGSAAEGVDEVMAETDAVGNAQGDDKLSDTIFKSPVIIVALTASSLQSDRHEALAAGCNDFLTKVTILFPLDPILSDPTLPHTIPIPSSQPKPSNPHPPPSPPKLFKTEATQN